MNRVKVDWIQKRLETRIEDWTNRVKCLDKKDIAFNMVMVGALARINELERLKKDIIMREFELLIVDVDGLEEIEGHPEVYELNVS